MKRLLLLFMLLANPAFAVSRIAVVYDQAGSASGAAGVPTGSFVIQTLETILNRQGMPFDRYYASARTWNLDRAQTGKADSTWFRERYAAVIIPYLEGNSGTTTPGWGTNFVNAAGTAGIQHSPLNGRWTIPTFVLYVNNSGAMSGSTDETANNWVPGIRASGGFRNNPPIATRGTWGNRLIARIRGDQRDTLYTQSSKSASAYLAWPGNGSVAVIVYADTAANVWGFANPTDTLAFVWRFRPVAGLPGIVYSILPTLSQSNIEGTLIPLQMIYSQTDAVPARKIQIPLMIHNDYPGALNATAKAHLQAVHDTLLANGISWSDQLLQTSSNDYFLIHDADTRAEIRRVLADGRANVTWSPGSNGSGHTFTSGNAADTAEVRKAFNADMNTATNADSFAFPRSKMRLARIVTASGQVGAWQSKVLIDAGVKVIESTITTSATWSLPVPSGGFGQMARFQCPTPGDNRTIFIAGTVGLTDGATFTGLTGGGSQHEYVGANVTQRIGWVAQTYSSLYWHANLNVTGTDGYMRWFASVIARHFACFNRVIEPARDPVVP